MENMLLSVKNLEVCIDHKKILDNIHMSIGNQEIVSIVGESGSGKTTLIKSISGLMPSKGSTVKGDLVFQGKAMTPEKMTKCLGKEMAYVFQNPGNYLDPIKKIGNQYVNCIRRHKGVNPIEATYMARTTLMCLKFKDVDKVMNAYPHELSGGMKQRVALGMALSLEPKLIIADEPTSALDVMSQKEIMNEILELRKEQGTSFLVVTHNLGCAAGISDRIIVMQSGKVVESGSTSKIIKDPQCTYTQKLIQSVPLMKGERYEPFKAV